MILRNVTITGADGNVNRKDLYRLSKKYPFVEWGILWYPKKMGQPRYPQKEWIKSLLRYKPKNVQVSLHICGVDAVNFAYNRKEQNFDESEVWGYIFKSERIQLNLPASSYDVDDVIALLSRQKNYDFRYAVNRYHALNPGRYVIIQANEGNKILNACLEREPAIEFLFDESRGNGKTLKEYSLPIPRKYNGYAGGISPDNVLAVLHDLNKIVQGSEEIWIDMESGVRTNDEFDLVKVRSVLEDVKSYIYQNLGKSKS